MGMKWKWPLLILPLIFTHFLKWVSVISLPLNEELVANGLPETLNTLPRILPPKLGSIALAGQALAIRMITGKMPLCTLCHAQMGMVLEEALIRYASRHR